MSPTATVLRDELAIVRAHPVYDDAERRAQYLRVAKEFREQTLSELRARHYAGAPGSAIVEALTQSVDELLRELFGLAVLERARNGSTEMPCALVALGGYGRGALFPCSDLDVMLVHEKRLTSEIEALNSFLLYFLWDVGFKVGHSVRSIAEATRFAQVDDTAKTAMLESRLIAGNEETFARYQDAVLRQVRAKGIEKFILLKQREREKSYRELGTDVYAREPHVKQSAGGLRDYQTALWIAIVKFGLRTPREMWQHGLISEEEFLRVELALDFLYRVRTHLHFEAGSQDDHLSLECQEQIARAFAYEATDMGEAVELFMQDYYMNATQLHRFYEHVLALGRKRSSRLKSVMARLTAQQLDRGLQISQQQVFLPENEQAWFREDPVRLLEVVWYVQKYGLELSDRARARIRQNAELIDDEFRRSPVARDYFLAMLNSPDRAGLSLRLLDDMDLLARYLPEFGDIKGIVRYESFHQHPVEEHTLRAVENLAMVGQLEDKSAHALKTVLEGLARPDLLALAILLHDVGKVDEENHVDTGVAIAERVARRLGLSAEDTATVVFLVRQHLKMTKLSQYRDMDEPKIIEHFAEELGTEERLDLLYLLTFCDVTAVRDGSWTDWKAALLLDLYMRTRAAFHGEGTGELAPAPEAMRQATYELLPADARRELGTHLKGMRPQYPRYFAPEDIANHVLLARRVRARTYAFHFADKPAFGCSEITVATRDRPGLFSEAVGAMASLGINILDAGIFTRDDGVAIDVFRVIDARSAGPLGPDRWDTVRRRLRQVLQGERRVEDLLTRTPPGAPVRQEALASARLNVSFDNHVSEAYTVIDLEAGDRMGLLYDVAARLAQLDLDLSLAKITTDVRQAHDAFYVCKRDGSKITSPTELEAVREALLEAAAGAPAERSTA